MDQQLSSQQKVVDLKSISEGSLPVDEGLSTSSLVKANKFKNKVLRQIVVNLREVGYVEKSIVELLLVLDNCTEKGWIDENFIENWKTDPEFINKLLENK